MPRLSKAKHAQRANLAKAHIAQSQAIVISALRAQVQVDNAFDTIHQQDDSNHETQVQLEEGTMNTEIRSGSINSEKRSRVYQGDILRPILHQCK